MPQWLLHAFSIEQLNQGAGVLDVAGGRGEVSFQLHLSGVRVTCIDRRVCKPCKAMLKCDTPKALQPRPPPPPHPT